MASNNFPLRAYFGHHKCATSWIDQILMEMCFHMGLHLKIVHRPVEWEGHGSLTALVEEVDADLVAYTNATIDHVADLPFTRAFHVVRDPRDILVSAYFSHLKTHPTDNWPELGAHRAHLSTLSKEKGLFAEMDFSAGQFEDMYTWNYEQPDVLELKLEELSPAPYKAFTAIVQHLQLLDDHDDGGLTDFSLWTNRWLYRARHVIPQVLHPPRLVKHQVLPQHTLDAIIEMKSFKKLSGGRKRGEEDASSHFRKGQPGDWANHFSDEHKAAFKERFNHVLVKLGYEDDDSW